MLGDDHRGPFDRTGFGSSGGGSYSLHVRLKMTFKITIKIGYSGIYIKLMQRFYCKVLTKYIARRSLENFYKKNNNTVLNIQLILRKTIF
jgi:hypothetical protein